MKREIILAIETAIGGGSISLSDKKSEIDFYIGESEMLRAENLLVNISEMLIRNDLRTSDIKKIVYSEGPGSHTGIRIASATAKGLQTALGCECVGETMLKALTLVTNSKGLVRTAIQTPQNKVWHQDFEKKEDAAMWIKTSANLITDEVFWSEISERSEKSENNDFQEVVLLTNNNDLYKNGKIIQVRTDANLARLIGLVAQREFFV